MNDQPIAEGDVNTSPHRTAWSARLDEQTRQLLDADAAVFVHQSVSTPCLDVVVGVRGATLTDIQGREFLDFHGNSAHQVGYGHPAVVAAVRRQLDDLPFSPRRYTNTAAIELAQRLVDLSPGHLQQVLFAPSGAAAVAIALKLARYATGRHKTVSMWDAFHGANIDTISVGGETSFRRGLGPLLPGGEHVPPLHLAERFFGSDGHAHERLADYLDYMLEIQGDVAAVIAEPVRWTTAEVPPPDFWPRVRASCDRHGALLVFDEIPSCLGRTGTMFACEQFGAEPDILVIGKGLGGAVMPMAATLVRRDLDIPAEAAIGHYTHEKSPLGAAAGLAVLDVVTGDGFLQRVRDVGASFRQRLCDLAERSPLIGRVRGIGMHWGVSHRALVDWTASEVADRVLYACLEGGLSYKVGSGTVAVLSPPLTITDEELDRAFGIFESALRQVRALSE